MNSTEVLTRPDGATGAPAPVGLLVRHTVALLIVLIVLAPMVGTHFPFSADEGAALAQVDLLLDRDWTDDHPFPAADPDDEAYPFELSVRTDDGYAPFFKHTAYIALLAPMVALGGTFGAVLLSLFGTAVAALCAALLARRVRPGLEVATIWIVGLGSPLLFDSQLVIAHSLGAAAATAAVLVATNALDGPSRRWTTSLLGVAVLVLGGTLLRNEAVLFGLALAAVLGVLGLRRRRLHAVVLGAVAGAAALSGLVVDRMISRALIGAAEASAASGGTESGTGSWFGDRLHGAWVTGLMPSYRGLVTADVLTFVGLAAAVGAACLVRWRPSEGASIRVLAAIAAATAVARLSLAPTDVTPGVLVAFPLLPVGLVLLGRDALQSTTARVAAGTAGLFALAVLATQYSTGGSGEWGGRYFALAVPMVVPVLLAALVVAGSRLDPRTTRVATAALAVAVVALAGQSVLSLRAAHGRVERIVEAVEATSNESTAGDGGPPVVVTIDGALPRFAWRHLDERRWLLVPEDRVEAYGEQLQALGVERFVFVARDGGQALERLATDSVVTSSERPIGASSWTISVVEIGSR